MARILCIETSTTVCSVALSVDGRTANLKEDLSGGYSHAEQLNVFIEAVLDGFNYSSLDAIAISSGPGSYTGLRIGTSAAKGIAYAVGIPLISISSLEAMCEKVDIDDANTLLIPMIDARRMEVYCSGYNTSGVQIFPTRAEILSPESFAEYDSFNRRIFFGQGSEKCMDILVPKGFEHLPGIFASADSMAGFAESKFNLNDFENTAYFEPFYLKDFVAGKKKGG